MLNSLLIIGLDLFIFAASIYMAITQRGTLLGWVFAVLVCWQVYALVKAIRD